MSKRKNSTICKYFSCQVAKRSGRDCADFENCQTYKFFENYGEDYMALGTGAMMIPPSGLEATARKA